MQTYGARTSSAINAAAVSCMSGKESVSDSVATNPREGVEESVCERVVLKPRNGRFRMPALAAEHVVPLKDLVENDFRPQTRPDRCPGGFRGRVDV
jgi:hypothetical protein